MNSEEQLQRWPLIGQSDVTNICHAIQESILELERAFETGQLSNKLNSGLFEQVLGPHLSLTYRKLANCAPGPLHHLRADAVGALIAQLENDLQPTQFAHAQMRMPAESDLCAAGPQTQSGPKWRYKIADASFGGASTTALRFDQMLAARFWRIGFTLETSGLCDDFAQVVVRSATVRLASELLSLRRILDRFKPTGPVEKIKIVPYPDQKRFERLILDILNEDVRRARDATLEEDFLEKTDLRVQYPELDRRRGARVQVTSITAREEHKAKLQAIRLVEEFVLLSPISLAEFVGSVEGETQAAEISSTSPLTLGPFWDCLDAKPADVAQLASELKRIMFRALKDPADSPLGPMVQVPGPIRQLIRNFVETEAFASTRTLRKRLPVISGNPETSEDDVASD